MNNNAGPLLLFGSRRGPLVDDLSFDEMCHSAFFRCFVITILQQWSEDKNMKVKHLLWVRRPVGIVPVLPHVSADTGMRYLSEPDSFLEGGDFDEA